MSCGKKKLVKNWDKPKNIRKITLSKYQQNEPSVKRYWRDIFKEIELLYKDDKFWETNCDAVRTLLKPNIFERIAKIFNLPMEAKPYQPPSVEGSVTSSNNFYRRVSDGPRSHVAVPSLSEPSFIQSVSEEEAEEKQEEEEESEWSSTAEEEEVGISRVSTMKSMILTKSLSRVDKDYSGSLSKTGPMAKSFSGKMLSKSRTSQTIDSMATTYDDLDVQHGSKEHRNRPKGDNPFFHMLYCNESETDMIKWKSNYKEKKIEVSASDEFSKKAELLTKKIAIDFYEWWVGLGTLEHKSEIKRPEDIEDLFQVWFNEHASRGLKLDPKILPCVLSSIAKYCGAPKAACPNMLKRHIAADIRAETSPAHTRAFNTSLPLTMRHIPPNNNTKEVWHCLKIPQDLKTMTAIWEDIDHLTSTKAFRNYLQARPHLPMPPCFFKEEEKKKQLFVVPSDFVLVRPDRSSEDLSQADLTIPVSKFNLEVKEVLSKLLRD